MVIPLASDSDDHGQQYHGLNIQPNSESKILMMDPENVPKVANIKISNVSRLHDGQLFVCKNVYTPETSDDKPSPKYSFLTKPCIHGFIIGFAVTVFIFTASLIFTLYIIPGKDPGRLDTGLNETWYVLRSHWQAVDGSDLKYLQLPVKYVTIAHSGIGFCIERYSCINEVMQIQKEQLNKGWSDIGPNYLIGGNGMVFEGRGANILSSMMKDYNNNSISVMFLGDYEHDQIVKEQFDHLGILLKQLVKLKVLDPNYTILPHCQVNRWTLSPGRHVIEGLRNFANWDNVTHWNNFNENICSWSERD